VATLKERLKGRAVFALLLGFFWSISDCGAGDSASAAGGWGVWRMVGDLLVVAALLSEAFYTVRGKALVVKHSPLLITSAAIVGSALFWLPVGIGEVVVVGWHTLSLVTGFWLIWLAVMATISGLSGMVPGAGEGGWIGGGGDTIYSAAVGPDFRGSDAA